MKQGLIAWIGVGVLTAAVALTAQSETPAPARRPPAPAPAASHPPVATADSQNALVKQYCVTCHNDRAKTGGMTLSSFNAVEAAKDAELTEKMIRKLRVGMMPPAGARRPAPEVLTGSPPNLSSTVYSFGALLFAAQTGAAPDGRSRVSALRHDLQRRQAQ